MRSYFWLEIAERHRECGVGLPFHDAKPGRKLGQGRKLRRFYPQRELARVQQRASRLVREFSRDLDAKRRRFRERAFEGDTADKPHPLVTSIRRRAAAPSLHTDQRDMTRLFPGDGGRKAQIQGTNRKTGALLTQPLTMEFGRK